MKRILFVGLLSTPWLLGAQAGSVGDTLVTMDLVTVSDGRIETAVMSTGRSIEIISQATIRQLPVQTVHELLQYVAGLDLRQRGPWGTQADVSLRGGSFDQTLVLVNGIKLSDPQTGHHQLNLSLDLGAVRQVEILRGPAAARYGLNAMSGVINIITDLPQGSGVRLTASAGRAADSQLPDSLRLAYQLGLRVFRGNERFRQQLQWQRMESSGHRTNTDFLRHALFYQGLLRTGSGDWQLMGQWLRNAFGASGFYAYPIDASSREEVETSLLALQHEQQRGDWRLRAKLYGRLNKDTYTLFRLEPQRFQNRHRTEVGGAELHATYGHRWGRLSLGTEGRTESISSNNLGQRARQHLGFFVQQRFELLRNRLSVNAGFYHNFSSDFGQQWMPAVELSYAMRRQFSLFANTGRGFRLPTFTDLYYRGPSNLGNEALQPERAHQWEGGGKWSAGNHQAQLSVFWQRATDLIDWVRASTAEPWQVNNYEAVSNQGLEWSYQYRRRRSPPADGLVVTQLQCSYTYMNPRLLRSEPLVSRYALSHLNHQLNLQAVLQLSRHWALSAQCRYLDREAYRSYALGDVRLQYGREAYRIQLDINNLWDTYYEELANAPMPGRWLRLGVELFL